jgi:putative ATPase
MRGLGYGKGNEYAHEYEEALTDQEHLPEGLVGIVYYQPGGAGRDGRPAEYPEKYRAYRKEMAAQKNRYKK